MCASPPLPDDLNENSDSRLGKYTCVYSLLISTFSYFLTIMILFFLCSIPKKRQTERETRREFLGPLGSLSTVLLMMTKVRLGLCRPCRQPSTFKFSRNTYCVCRLRTAFDSSNHLWGCLRCSSSSPGFSQRDQHTLVCEV